MNLNSSLKSIREVLDSDTVDTDIENVLNKLQALIQLSGLASECKARAKQSLEEARLLSIIRLRELKPPLQPSLLLKMAEAECAKENASFVYADRLNASISHSIEGLRSVISWQKEELNKSLIQINQRR